MTVLCARTISHYYPNCGNAKTKAAHGEHGTRTAHGRDVEAHIVQREVHSRDNRSGKPLAALLGQA
jgi:hypothetical protein